MLFRYLLCIYFASLLLSAGYGLKLEKYKPRRDLSPMEMNNYIKSYDSSSCLKYFCKEPNITFAIDTWHYAVLSTNNYIVQKCNGNLECMKGIPGFYNYACISPEPSSNNYLPGEKCKSFSDCDPNYCKSCINGICIGVGLDYNCNNNKQCNPWYYCSSNNLCEPQLPRGAYGCRNDYDCINGAACNITGDFQLGRCLPYFSLLSGMYVGNCDQGQSYLCISITCASYGLQFKCTNPLKSISTPPVSCLIGSLCYSSPDFLFNPPYQDLGSCLCSASLNGTSYCSLFPGDALYSEYLNQFEKWIKSAEIDKCNTFDRFNEACISSWWDTENYTKLINLYESVLYYGINIVIGKNVIYS